MFERNIFEILYSISEADFKYTLDTAMANLSLSLIFMIISI